MIETVRVLVGGGLLMLLLLLRLEAAEFGAAEYDEPGYARRKSFTLRMSWYLVGFALIACVYFIHPQPRDILFLVLGHRTEALLYGITLGVLGMLQAVMFALYRYRDLRLPNATAYPGAAINAIGTAIVDEATFRGILSGMLIAAGMDVGLVVIVQAILYALATRLGAKGRHPYMLLLALGIGLFAGWATVQTGGIGAAIFGHAVAKFALFICTGHAGQVTRRGREPEEVERVRRPPAGWQDARSGGSRAAPPAVRPAPAPRTAARAAQPAELPEPRGVGETRRSRGDGPAE